MSSDANFSLCSENTLFPKSLRPLFKNGQKKCPFLVLPLTFSDTFLEIYIIYWKSNLKKINIKILIFCQSGLKKLI